MDVLPRRPLSFSYVTYVEGDLYGYIFAWMSHLPGLLFFFEVLLLVILFTSDRPSPPTKGEWENEFGRFPWVWHEWNVREFRVWLSWSTFGQLINETIARALKEYLKHPRPDVADRLEFGMPSSHAQFMAYWVAFLACRLLGCIGDRGHQQDSRRRASPSRTACILVVALLALASVSISRWYLGYHYLVQIVVGWLLGAGFALVWSAVGPLVFAPFQRPHGTVMVHGKLE